MGVARSGQDTGSEHTGRSACYLADFGNSIGVGFVSGASIALSECPTTASTRTGNSAALHCQPVLRSVMGQNQEDDLHGARWNNKGRLKKPIKAREMIRAK